MLAVALFSILPGCFVIDSECRPYIEQSVSARKKLVITLETDGQRFTVARTRPKLGSDAMKCLEYSASQTVPTTTEKRTVNVHVFASRPRAATSAPNVRRGGFRGDIEQADQNIVCADRAEGLASQIVKACLDNPRNRGRGRVIVDWRGDVTFDPPSLAELPEGECVTSQVQSMEDELGRRRPIQLVAYAESGAILYRHEEAVDKCEAVLRDMPGYAITLRLFAEEDDVVPTYRWLANHQDLLRPCFGTEDELARNGYALELERDREKSRFSRVEFVGKVRPFPFRALCIRRKLLRAKLPPIDGRWREVVAPLSYECLDDFSGTR